MPLVDAKGYKAAAFGSYVYVLERPGRANEPAPANLDAPQVLHRLPADQVLVPALKGKSLKAAAGELETLGLKPIPDAKAPPQAPVVDQKPGPG